MDILYLLKKMRSLTFIKNLHTSYILQINCNYHSVKYLIQNYITGLYIYIKLS